MYASATTRDAKLEALHAQLTSAVEALVSGEDWKRALTFAAQFRSRSFNNTLLIYAQHYAAYGEGRVPEPTPTYVAGFHQWLSLGRHVEKGQHGYGILAPVTARFASREPGRRHLVASPRPRREARTRRGRSVQAHRPQTHPRLGRLPDLRRPDPRTTPPGPPPGRSTRRPLGRSRRPDHRGRIRAPARVLGRGDRRRQRDHRLPHPRGLDPDGHGRRCPGQDARPRTRPRPPPPTAGQQALHRASPPTRPCTVASPRSRPSPSRSWSAQPTGSTPRRTRFHTSRPGPQVSPARRRSRSSSRPPNESEPPRSASWTSSTPRRSATATRPDSTATRSATVPLRLSSGLRRTEAVLRP